MSSFRLYAGALGRGRRQTVAGRRHSARQNQPRSVCHGPVGHALAVWRVPQQLRRGVHRRRLELRIRRRGRHGHCKFWLGHRYRGLRPGAGGIQQRRRPEAEPGALEHPGRRARMPFAGLRIDFRAYRRGRRTRARCRRRIRCRGSVRPASREHGACRYAPRRDHLRRPTARAAAVLRRLGVCAPLR